jgi:hypothetical protein
MSSEQAIGPGQWIGELSGVNVPSGWLTISIEADRPEAGFACMQQGDPFPPWRVRVTWKKDGSKIIGKSFGQALVFDDKEKSLVPRENHSNRESFNLPDTIRPGRFRTRGGMMRGAPGCGALGEDGCRRHPSV